MSRLWQALQRHPDRWLALALAAGYLSLLLASAGSLGFTRDEGFYFAASRQYGAWFELLLHEPTRALEPDVVDRYWSVNREHPALLKSAFALSHRWLFTGLGVFSEPSTSFRFPAMLLSSLAVAVTFLWGKRVLGRAAGLVAALSFAFMPRVFHHAHLACFDLPVSALWLVTSYVYARSLSSPRLGWVVGAGVMYGLLLDTKHNSWIFPFAIGAHFLITRGPRALRERRLQLPLAWLSMALVGPLLFYALWPWIWHDTAPRLREYVAFHTGHEYYNMEFLGQTYWKPPMPRGYAWLMTLATVPAVTLLLAGAGGARFATRLRLLHETERSEIVLWGVCVLASYAPWLSSSTPIFGGTKHWMTAYPFLCLFAGLGFQALLAAARELLERASVARGLLARPGLIAVALGGCVLAGPLLMTAHAHPFGLSFYTPLVGGAPGAASLGLNRTFWGYTTGSLTSFLNGRSPARASVYVHDTALQSFAMFQEDGRLRADLRPTLSISNSSVALYHHEPHMSRVEYQLWVDYGLVSPEAIATYEGVPISWCYARSRSTPSR